VYYQFPPLSNEFVVNKTYFVYLLILQCLHGVGPNYQDNHDDNVAMDAKAEDKLDVMCRMSTNMQELLRNQWRNLPH
jgi:hypothetical protein